MRSNGDPHSNHAPTLAVVTLAAVTLAAVTLAAMTLATVTLAAVTLAAVTLVYRFLFICFNNIFLYVCIYK